MRRLPPFAPVPGAAAPSVERTGIPGLIVVRLPVHADHRGWFKENWQREKLTTLGLPDFGPVQHNVAWNARAGTTRGFHAEPWDKLISVATGRVFAAFVDLRDGPTFGTLLTGEVDPSVAVLVPRGVANAYQTLDDGTAYTYLVNDHWSPDTGEQSAYVNLADPQLAVRWPIPLADAALSDADRTHPSLDEIQPVRLAAPLVLGAGGQVGRALLRAVHGAIGASREQVDLAAPDLAAAVRWSDHDVIYNAAAFTKVDLAETPDGRPEAWRVNVGGVGALVGLARRHRSTLVHVSSDYVYDGRVDLHHEDEQPAPLGVYGQTKAAGDALVATLPTWYVVRTSWVVGAGANFVRTMADLADRGANPQVVDDQFGRITLADDVARAAAHLVATAAAPGIYHVSSSGDPMSWAEIARVVFAGRGRDPGDVRAVSTATYAAGRALARRPMHSTLALDKLVDTGFRPTDHRAAIAQALAATD